MTDLNAVQLLTAPRRAGSRCLSTASGSTSQRGTFNTEPSRVTPARVTEGIGAGSRLRAATSPIAPFSHQLSFERTKLSDKFVRLVLLRSCACNPLSLSRAKNGSSRWPGTMPCRPCILFASSSWREGNLSAWGCLHFHGVPPPRLGGRRMAVGGGSTPRRYELSVDNQSEPNHARSRPRRSGGVPSFTATDAMMRSAKFATLSRTSTPELLAHLEDAVSAKDIAGAEATRL